MSKREPTHPLTVRIPRSLFDEVRLLMIDPARGKARKGSWQTTVTQLLREWCAAQYNRRTNTQHAQEFARDPT